MALTNTIAKEVRHESTCTIVFQSYEVQKQTELISSIRIQGSSYLWWVGGTVSDRKEEWRGLPGSWQCCISWPDYWLLGYWLMLTGYWYSVAWLCEILPMYTYSIFCSLSILYFNKIYKMKLLLFWSYHLLHGNLKLFSTAFKLKFKFLSSQYELLTICPMYFSSPVFYPFLLSALHWVFFNPLVFHALVYL